MPILRGDYPVCVCHENSHHDHEQERRERAALTDPAFRSDTRKERALDPDPVIVADVEGLKGIEEVVGNAGKGERLPKIFVRDRRKGSFKIEENEGGPIKAKRIGHGESVNVYDVPKHGATP